MFVVYPFQMNALNLCYVQLSTFKSAIFMKIAPPKQAIMQCNSAEKSENWKSIPIVPFDVNGKISSMQSKQLIVMSLE